MQKQQPVYADIHHSTNPPAAPPPTELKLVVYAEVKQSANSSDAPLSSEYADIGHHVEVMEEAVQETCPTSCKGQCPVLCHVSTHNNINGFKVMPVLKSCDHYWPKACLLGNAQLRLTLQFL